MGQYGLRMRGLVRSYVTLAIPGNEQHPPPHTRLPAHVPHEAPIRLYIEMHYSLWKNDMDNFRGYILGKIHDGRIVRNEQI
jgi:hypothetical protein